MTSKSKIMGAVATEIVAVVLLTSPAFAAKLDTFSRNNGRGATMGGSVYDENGYASINPLPRMSPLTVTAQH